MRIAVATMALLAAAAAFAQGTYRWVDADGQVHYSDQPPPADARKVEEKHYSANRADTVLPYTLRKLSADFPVTLYTAENCHAPCADARRLLAQRGVPFAEKVIKTEGDVAAYRQRFGTPDTVPALTVGRQTAKGFAAEPWNALLDSVGYPKTPLPPQ